VEQKWGPLYYYCTPWWRFQKVETKVINTNTNILLSLERSDHFKLHEFGTSNKIIHIHVFYRYFVLTVPEGKNNIWALKIDCRVKKKQKKTMFPGIKKQKQCNKKQKQCRKKNNLTKVGRWKSKKDEGKKKTRKENFEWGRARCKQLGGISSNI
jgi:hypothetical protein